MKNAFPVNGEAIDFLKRVMRIKNRERMIAIWSEHQHAGPNKPPDS